MTTNTSVPSGNSRNSLLRRRAPIVWIDAGLRVLTLVILLLVGWSNAAAEHKIARAPAAGTALQSSPQDKLQTPNGAR